MMNKARDLILELYKEDKITKDEVDILLDAIAGRDCCYNPPIWQTNKLDWTYDHNKPGQPWWTITNNADKTSVE